MRGASERDIELWELDDDDLAAVDAQLTPEVRTVLSVRGSLAARSAHGGTAPARVAEQLAALADAAPTRRAAWAAGEPLTGCCRADVLARPVARGRPATCSGAVVPRLRRRGRRAAHRGRGVRR